jgi:predicted enzyme related to lactoylglutathione lyase
MYGQHYIEHGVAMPELKTPRIVQVTINVGDLTESISFYRAAFDAAFNEDISSFQFGAWPADDFFLLTVNRHGEQHGPGGPSRFGLLVSDLDTAHRRALDAGAGKVYPPVDKPWKPRVLLRGRPQRQPHRPLPGLRRRHAGPAGPAWAPCRDRRHDKAAGCPRHPRQVNLGNATYRWESQGENRRVAMPEIRGDHKIRI